MFQSGDFVVDQAFCIRLWNWTLQVDSLVVPSLTSSSVFSFPHNPMCAEVSDVLSCRSKILNVKAYLWYSLVNLY